MTTKRMKMGGGRQSQGLGFGSGWNGLPLDVLLMIFSRLDRECPLKTVYSVSPCWRSASRLLVFRPGNGFLEFSIFKHVPVSDISHFMELLNHVLDDIDMQYKSEVVTRLHFPTRIHLQDHHFFYVAQRCPSLRCIHLPHMLTMQGFSAAVQCWKDLRRLIVRSFKSSDFVHFIEALGSNCKFLEYLALCGVDSTLEPENTVVIDKCASQLIANSLCTVRTLIFIDYLVHKSGLEYLMAKCSWVETIIFGKCINISGRESSFTTYRVKRETREDNSSNWSTIRSGRAYKAVRSILDCFW